MTSIGILIAVSGVIAFRRARTTVNPMRPRRVVAGRQQHLPLDAQPDAPRHADGAGWAAYLARPWALLLPVFMLYMNRFQIGPEERAREGIFGSELDANRRKERRWL